MDRLPTPTESASTRSDAPTFGRPASLWRVLIGIGLVACLPTIGGLGARLSSSLELCVHFRAYYAAGFLVATVIFLVGRKWKWGAVWAVFFLWNAAGIVPFYFRPAGSSKPHQSRFSLKLLSANVLSENRDYQRLIDLIRKENPDVVIAIEVDQNWARALKTLETTYSYHAIRPRSDNFGIAFYSRVATDLLESKVFGSANVPSIVARLDGAHGHLTIIGTHPLPPVMPDFAALRNDQFSRIAEFVRKIDGPVVVAGDFNTTSWSPYFQDLRSSTKLCDSRIGFGIQPTWTGGWGIVRIPIDHVLVSPGIDVQDRRVGDDIGSDHRPVIVDLRIP